MTMDAPLRDAFRDADGQDAAPSGDRSSVSRRPPRLGFLGVGWIGRHRMTCLIEAGAATVAAIADPSEAMREAAAALAPGVPLGESLDDLLGHDDLDGVVIATPSARHAEETIRALDAGLAVFCQKPLGRTADEVATVIDAAKRADRLLAVDFCYRHTEGMKAVRRLAADGDLGEIFAADLVFHNAYGPDKPWFHDPAQSGGGCVMDLGVHLVDLALWVLGFPEVAAVTSDLHAGGRRLGAAPAVVEDHAVATLRLAGGAVVRIATSWNLHAGEDAQISATFHGTAGGATFRNVGGSFYDFTADHLTGTARQTLVVPPDAWGGRAIVDFARRLADGERHDPATDELHRVATVVDRIYGR